jgi:tRNA 2-thiouridine synthesizing protein E
MLSTMDSGLPEMIHQEESIMVDTMDSILHPGQRREPDPAYPHAPADWTRKDGEAQAQQEGLKMGDDHWELVHALQEFYARHEPDTIQLRELSDALDEHFHHKGGTRYLFTIFPGGPIAQGCRIAGLDAPPGAENKGFGSVA